MSATAVLPSPAVRDDDALAREFRQWLKRRMDEENLTQQALAVALGVSLSSVAAWAQGRQLPDYASVVRLRGLLGSLPFE